MRTRVVRSACGAAALSGLGLLCAAAPASAQHIPDGSYAQTCRHIYMNGPYLNAICRRIDGGWNATRIYAPRCEDDGISNHDGILSCGAY